MSVRRITSLIVIAALTVLVSGCAKKNPKITAEPSYIETVFAPDCVHTVDIRITKNDWKDLLAHPLDKTKYHADITIDGTTVKDVSFSTKGNSSLSFVAKNEHSDRYSFKVNFGKFQKGQTFDGLDSLNLNNMIGDTACMKDYICYRLFAGNGVPAPLASYVWLTVNGEDHGLYMAVEDPDKSFLERIGGSGALYRPEADSLLVVDDKGAIIDSINGMDSSEAPSAGAALAWINDDPESYPDIFKNSETGHSPEAEQRMITALKALSERKDLETYLSTDEIIRYFAVHNFVLNYDSYTGPMLHNYILHEQDGKLSMYPWDYNTAFGAFQGRSSDKKKIILNSTEWANYGIDSPLAIVKEEDRPMWAWIIEDEDYQKQYHRAMDDLVASFFESGKFAEEVEQTKELLYPYVQKDPTRFYSEEAFLQGTETLKQFGLLRAESIRKQLDGSLAAVSAEQSEEARVDASALNLSTMGNLEMELLPSRK